MDRRRWILAVASAALTLLALEAALRVFDLARGVSTRARTSWYWMFEQDPQMGFRGRPRATTRTPWDSIVHNSEGFRDARDLAALVSDASGRLVICVGESSTYGVAAGSGDRTYPAALERALIESTGDPSWHVFNAGQPGYTTSENLDLVKFRLLKARPAAILAMTLRNDHEFYARTLDDALDYPRYPLRLASRSATWSRELLMRSSLYGFVVGRLRRPFPDDLGGVDPGPGGSGLTTRGRKLYLDNLAMLALLCARSGTRLLMVDQPVDLRGYDDDRRESLSLLRGDLAAFCARSGTPLLEAHERLDWSDLSAEDDVHLGAAGYERLARILAPQVAAALETSPPPSDTEGMSPHPSVGDPPAAP